ncbi:uncharacterized protein [Asterias amurensis]|uniref:uncharacterized protein n=1 Tax=Asterias amurensis TaxID=7602 RepID=UPI003AB3059E
MARTNRISVSVALTCVWLITMVSCHSSAETSYQYSTSNSNYVIVTSKQSWSDARDACAATGSHLVYVSSADENQALSDAIVGFGASTSDYWMGLVGTGGDSWVWLDGVGPGYTNWPDSGKRDDDDCITLHVSSQTWKAHNCDSDKKYICEEEEIITTTLPTTINVQTTDNEIITTTLATTTKVQTTRNEVITTTLATTLNVKTTENVCPDGFQFFQTSCYRAFSEEPINGLDARAVCAQLSSDTHLVFIESQSEQTFLQEFVQALGVVMDFWIGLTITSDGDHEWLDGAPLGSFSVWDSTGHQNMHPCIRLRRVAEYTWNDRPCDVEYGYICEMEMTAQATILATEIITETPAEDEIQTMQYTTVVQLVDTQTASPFMTVTSEENLVLTELITETPAKDEDFQTMQTTTYEQHLVDAKTTSGTVTTEENLKTEASVTVLITEDITETPGEGGDFQTVQLSTTLHHLEDDIMTTPSGDEEGRLSTDKDHLTTSEGSDTSTSTLSISTCKRREKNFYIHTVGKTFSDHVVFKTINRSLLKCAAACISEACTWFVATHNNDCLLSKEASVIEQLQSDGSAALYYVGG